MTDKFKPVVGFEDSYINSVSTTPAVAFYSVEELIDNAIDAGATEIVIDTRPVGTLSVRDNGHGITKEEMFELANRVNVRLRDENSATIGKYGQGLHSCLVRNSSFARPTKIKIVSAVPGKVSATCFTCVNDLSRPAGQPRVFINRRMEQVPVGEAVIKGHSQGTLVSMADMREEIDASQLGALIVKRYQHLAGRVRFTLNDRMLPLYDYCYLAQFSGVFADGVYERDTEDERQPLRQIVAHPVMNGKPMLVVGTLVNKKSPYYKYIKGSDKADSRVTGLYINFNGKLMEAGGQSSWSHIGKISNSGGEGSIRIYVDASGFGDEIGVSADKSRPLPWIKDMGAIREDSTGKTLDQYLTELRSELRRTYNTKRREAFFFDFGENPDAAIGADEVLDQVQDQLSGKRKGLTKIGYKVDANWKRSRTLVLAYEVDGDRMVLTLNKAHALFDYREARQLCVQAGAFLAASGGRSLNTFNKFITERTMLQKAFQTGVIEVDDNECI